MLGMGLFFELRCLMSFAHLGEVCESKTDQIVCVFGDDTILLSCLCKRFKLHRVTEGVLTHIQNFFVHPR